MPCTDFTSAFWLIVWPPYSGTISCIKERRMVNASMEQHTHVDIDMLNQQIEMACRRIPPLWNLPNYTAVNPFLGFSNQPMAGAVQIMEQGLDAQVLPSLGYYQSACAAGKIKRQDIARAAARAGVDPLKVMDMLDDKTNPASKPTEDALLTLAQKCDLEQDSDWHEQSLRATARWCAVYTAADTSNWPGTTPGQSLFANWRTYASADHSLELLGLHGWRQWIANLPDDHQQAMAQVMRIVDIDADERVEYFYKLLGGLYGWSSYLRRESWQKKSEHQSPLAEFLAVRLCTDVAIASLCQVSAKPGKAVVSNQSADVSCRMVLQDALEDDYARNLLGSLNPPSNKQSGERPAVQAVFCIDVRSEILRRHLESQSDTIETRGFAGFFGLSIDWQENGNHSTRCPVLLQASLPVEANTNSFQDAWLPQTREIRFAATSAFSYVELLGLGYGLKLWSSTSHANASESHKEESVGFTPKQIDLATRTELAAGILKNMGFTQTFARIVLLCGHGSSSNNNPHATGLDCGACGGHSGAINARVAAALLNDPQIRTALKQRGINLPTDTQFVPAVHNTSSDEVSLLDVAAIASSHHDELASLKQWLLEAGRLTREERAMSLGLEQTQPSRLHRLFKKRARDWSEIRPEWALAGNASFIAARRQRTAGVNLQGRSFLHEYDAANDPDGAILTLILTAPAVVASWINLQYFASTVDNHVFGSGNKVLHNLVGSHGVVLGNGGDLRTGLAEQSVYTNDGKWYHQPLRLQLIVESPLEAVDNVLMLNPGVRDLVDHGWVRLFVINPQTANACHRWVPSHGWNTCALQEVQDGE
jgi:hypothetical protein